METNKYGPKAAAQAVNGEVWPEIPADLLAYLERTHPQRCFDPDREASHAHFRYAGKCELIATLRAQHERQREHPDRTIHKEF